MMSRSSRRFGWITAAAAAALGTLAGAAPAVAATLAATRPNVILVMTDDQGYGNLGCHGHPTLKTPHLDRMHAESTRFTAFHVSPTCSPTRASLLAGKHEFRSGVTHTITGRERMALSSVTLAQVLQGAGYKTGIFGKWHLGDTAGAYGEAGMPYMPQSRGFDEVFIHGGGGIGQGYPKGGDFGENSYFNPRIHHNGKMVETEGYCADVFFRQALRWIQGVKDAPFFAYISTNTPHSPQIPPKEYEGQGYEGMILNIDDNMGRLFEQIKQLGLEENTLVIFMSDNGHSAGYGAGMRGKKGMPNEGGTRVPCFFRWPGKIGAGADVGGLAAHVDMLPTLAEICGAAIPQAAGKLDGRSLVPLLENPAAPWPDRYLFVHVGRWPEGGAAEAKYSKFAVRSQRFRLVNKDKLYDISNDPGENLNVIEQHPDVAAKMLAVYDQWWEEILPALVNE